MAGSQLRSGRAPFERWFIGLAAVAITGGVLAYIFGSGLPVGVVAVIVVLMVVLAVGWLVSIVRYMRETDRIVIPVSASRRTRSRNDVIVRYAIALAPAAVVGALFIWWPEVRHAVWQVSMVVVVAGGLLFMLFLKRR